MPCSTELNCEDAAEFDADPDLAGIGVIVAFFLSAWITFAFVLITFFFVQAFPDDSMNDFDRRIVQGTRKLTRYIRRPFLHREDPISLEAIQKIALTLSDQQLITESSIFIVSYARHCVITQYHFYIAYWLGITSFTTHQSTIMIVRGVLRQNTFMKSWRMVWIVAIFFLVFVANIVVNNDYFLTAYGLSTQCVWDKLPGYYTPREVVLSIITSLFYAWGLLAVTRDLYPEATEFLAFCFMRFTDFLRLPSVKELYLTASAKTTRAAPRTMIYYLLWITDKLAFLFFLFYFTFSQIMFSQVMDLYRVFTILFCATYSIARLRADIKNSGMKGDEDTWGFGQILPLLLLALPISQVLEMLHDDWHKRNLKSQVQCLTTGSSAKDLGPGIQVSAQMHCSTFQNESASFTQTAEGTQPPTGDDSLAIRTGQASETNQFPRISFTTLRQIDNEMGRWSTAAQYVQQAAVSTSTTSTSTTDHAVENQLYASRIFWAWVILCMLTILGATLYGAVEGVVV